MVHSLFYVHVLFHSQVPACLKGALLKAAFWLLMCFGGKHPLSCQGFLGGFILSPMQELLTQTPRRRKVLKAPSGKNTLCQKTFRYLQGFYSLLFRGFFVALICLEKQCLGLFRGFPWLFRGFLAALILGKFYAYSP